jgi:hypothetical protein
LYGSPVELVARGVISATVALVISVFARVVIEVALTGAGVDHGLERPGTLGAASRSVGRRSS